MTPQRISLAALLVAVIALVVAALGLSQSASSQAQVASSQSSLAQVQKSLESAKQAADRIGVAAIAPEQSLGQPNVARDPSIVPPPITRTEPTTVEVTLTVKEVVAEIADGTTYSFWTFDGTVPGPMLRVMEGDTVKLTLVNPSTNKSGHNIDLHAVNGPGGGAAVTNVNPGESKTFTFKALNPGAFVYHCAFAPPYHHIAQGMYGAIVVEPRGGLPKVDREFYVMQGEWYTTGAFGDKGHQEFSGAKALAEQPEYFTFNGRTDALTKLYPLHAKVGETIRLFFGVGGPNVGSNFHIIGEIFDKVYSGSPQTFIANEETWYVPPGSVSTFELKLNEPGQYLLVDHALFRVAKGAAGILMADGDWNPDVYSPPALGASH
jgi:nitrite reductase (NO-forming)